MDKAQQDALKKAAGIEAAKLVENGMIAGLGTGSTVKFLVDELGRRHQEEGLEFTGVTTSRRTQVQAESYGIKIVDIDDVDHIDVDKSEGSVKLIVAERAPEELKGNSFVQNLLLDTQNGVTKLSIETASERDTIRLIRFMMEDGRSLNETMGSSRIYAA